MITGLAHAAITVGNMERSLAFYRDLLGFQVVRTKDLSTGGGKIVMLDIAGRGELELFQRSNTRPVPEGYGLPETIGLYHLALEVDDVQTEWERLEAHGVKSMGVPHYRQPDGSRCAHFYDPDGVVVELIEPSSKWWPNDVG